MNKFLLSCVAGVALAGSATAAGAVVFDFSSPSGNITNTHTYTVSGLTIVAKGFNWTGGTADLYGKNGGGDENGLGLANDPTGDNEIHYHSGYVQIDVSQLFGKADGLTFGTNSTTDGEEWTVYGSNSSGGTCGQSALRGRHVLGLSGTTEVTAQGLPSFGTYRYYDFFESTHTAGQGDNFLITNLATLEVTGHGGGVPEPATWAMMLLGFGGVGAALRAAHRRNCTASATT